MKKKLKCILLVDDQEECNYMHKRAIRMMGCAEKVHVAMNGKEAIDFLRSEEGGVCPTPELIFFDLNMPVMGGWEFLDEYDKLEEEQKSKIVLVLLTTSLNKKDKERAAKNKYIKEYVSKYLDESNLQAILDKYFSDYL
jgi:CheY-like chemotaxis protein